MANTEHELRILEALEEEPNTTQAGLDEAGGDVEGAGLQRALSNALGHGWSAVGRTDTAEGKVFS